MNKKEAKEILAYHNKWRRGADIKMTHPEKLGEAIDFIVSYLSDCEDKNSNCHQPTVDNTIKPPKFPKDRIY